MPRLHVGVTGGTGILNTSPVDECIGDLQRLAPIDPSPTLPIPPTSLELHGCVHAGPDGISMATVPCRGAGMRGGPPFPDGGVDMPAGAATSLAIQRRAIKDLGRFWDDTPPKGASAAPSGSARSGSGGRVAGGSRLGYPPAVAVPRPVTGGPCAAVGGWLWAGTAGMGPEGGFPGTEHQGRGGRPRSPEGIGSSARHRRSGSIAPSGASNKAKLPAWHARDTES